MCNFDIPLQGDHVTFLNVYKGFIQSDKSSKWCHKIFINYHAMVSPYPTSVEAIRVFYFFLFFLLFVMFLYHLLFRFEVPIVTSLIFFSHYLLYAEKSN